MMPVLKQTEAPYVEYGGAWGDFTAADRLTVRYLMTTVGPHDGRKLEVLRTVREVFDPRQLPFKHLLQRDLDDARTNNEIINGYLLADTPLPAFFPPVVAAVIPKSSTVQSHIYYPAPSDPEKVESEGYVRETLRYSEVLALTRYRDQERGHYIPEAVLKVHTDNADLVVIDGQHRLMAFQAAILGVGTLKEIYRPFYADSNLPQPSALAQAQLPLALLYFPDLYEGGEAEKSGEVDVRRACRAVFLDINRNARKPSRAREVLLNDSDLLPIFVQEVFESVKDEEPKELRLHHLEYDTPARAQKLSRPLALCDVFLTEACLRVLLTGEPGPRPAFSRQEELHVRTSLGLDAVLTEKELEEHGLSRTTLKYEDVPKRLMTRIVDDVFRPHILPALIYLLENLRPFAVHRQAVDELKLDVEQKTARSAEENLAFAMLFEAQGLWWLADKKPVTTAVEKATKLRNAWIEKFRAARSKLYLQKAAVTDGESSVVEEHFDLYMSKAFQVGLFRALREFSAYQSGGAGHYQAVASELVSLLNERFKDLAYVSRLFDRSNLNSVRGLFKRGRNLTARDEKFICDLLLSLIYDEPHKNMAEQHAARVVSAVTIQVKKTIEQASPDKDPADVRTEAETQVLDTLEKVYPPWIKDVSAAVWGTSGGMSAENDDAEDEDGVEEEE